ncbi:hypothetical protein JCM10296v2_007487 [Rhodotorula toruloides]
MGILRVINGTLDNPFLDFVQQSLDEIPLLYSVQDLPSLVSLDDFDEDDKHFLRRLTFNSSSPKPPKRIIDQIKFLTNAKVRMRLEPCVTDKWTFRLSSAGSSPWTTYKEEGKEHLLGKTHKRKQEDSDA